MAHRRSPRRQQPTRRVRVRSLPLVHVDEAKLAMALVMMARRLLAERAESEEVSEDKPRTRESGAEAA
jgi:hypothetical protein